MWFRGNIVARNSMLVTLMGWRVRLRKDFCVTLNAQMNYLFVFCHCFLSPRTICIMKCGLWRNLAKTFVKCNKIGHILFSLYGITFKRLSGLRNAPIRAVGKKILHRETNGKLSFYCYSPQWITTTFFMKKTEWFPIWFFTIWEMNNMRQPQSKSLSW